MAKFTAEDCYREIRNSIGASPNPSAPSRERMVNMAGYHFVNRHPWKFLEGRSATLDLRGKISVTDATYTQSSRTLTKTGAFANYTHLAGDDAKFTGGTGATVDQRIDVSSKTDSDSIVLETDIGAAADGQTDIDFELLLGTTALPSDFMELEGYDATESLTNSLHLVSPQELLHYRTNEVQVTTYNFYGVIRHAQANDNRGPQTPVLELWPLPDANDVGALTIFYRAGWSEVANDSDEISIPEYARLAFLMLVRQVALGFEEHRETRGGLEMEKRLAAWDMAPEVVRCIKRDGRVQPDFGPLRGGAVATRPHGYKKYLRTTVTGPS